MSGAQGEDRVERRISLDGGHYTIDQFVEFFGEAEAQWYWDQAEISTQEEELEEPIDVPRGVTVEVITPGDGTTFPKKGDKVTVHYTGTLARNGRKFDSSHDKGTPFEFSLGVGGVIQGWDEGVKRMSKGEHARLLISSEFAYGVAGDGLTLHLATHGLDAGSGASIPGGSDLVFVVELIGINMPTRRVLAGWDDADDSDEDDGYVGRRQWVEGNGVLKQEPKRKSRAERF